MHKRKREQMIEEEESKKKFKDKETINILADSLINITNEMDKLKAKVNELYSTINIQNSTINGQNSKINELHSTINRQNSIINELYSEINILESQRQKDQVIIAELSDFVFQAKLRKILKKMLGYIVSDKYLSKYLHFDTKERIWSFISAPEEININGISSSQVLDALNTLLKIIFTYTNNASYTIHFVNKEAISDIRLKKKIEVFNNFMEFFRYFKIENLQNILTKIIPLHYFTTIY
jgi:uncharacterized coiled-coil protein SlyX